ncbi:MAG: alpha/beta fold hydrolase [Proteobacteria bacterium]|nr:alpha/beta fold hydrolase [Pseudomonadota bacterium]
MTIERIDNGDIMMAYELSGPPDAPVVCLNHCFASGLGYWEPHLPAFEGFKVLRYDTRGHGRSDAPPGPYTLEMLAADVAGLQDALGIERVHFCGVSLGGQIAQTFALAYPERLASLILVNTTCEYTEAHVAMWRARARQALDGGIEAVHGPLMARWFTAEAAEQRTPGYLYMDKVVRNFAPESFQSASEAMCMLGTTERLPEIAAPTLIIATPEDPGAPREVSEKMARLIPNATLAWLEPARHLSSLEHPERFNRLVRDFLLRVSRDGCVRCR